MNHDAPVEYQSDTWRCYYLREHVGEFLATGRRELLERAYARVRWIDRAEGVSNAVAWARSVGR
jgi:hypothetical protein